MRYYSIDIMRSCAIIIMIVVHFCENLSGYHWTFAGFGAPMFAFLSGMSYRLWLNGQYRRGVSDDQISKVSIRRGLFLVGVGIVFNVVVWLPEDTFNWDVLTLIGVSLLLLNCVRYMPLELSGVISILVFLLSPMLRIAADHAGYWQQGYYDYDMTVTDVVLGFLVNGYFPVFPWIMYPLTGFMVSSLLFYEGSHSKERVWPLAGWGIALIIVSALLTFLGQSLTTPLATLYSLTWEMFPPSLNYITGTLGVTLCFFSMAHFHIDGNPHLNRYQVLLDCFTTFSRHSFSIYLVHHFLHIWPLWIYGYSQGNEDITIYWRTALSVNLALTLALLCVVVCYGMAYLMQKKYLPSIESSMRWLCE